MSRSVGGFGVARHAVSHHAADFPEGHARQVEVEFNDLVLAKFFLDQDGAPARGHVHDVASVFVGLTVFVLGIEGADDVGVHADGGALDLGEDLATRGLLLGGNSRGLAQERFLALLGFFLEHGVDVHAHVLDSHAVELLDGLVR